MRFKLDENMPRTLASAMSEWGHDVHTVADEHLGGRSDSVVARHAMAEERIVVTYDMDFSDIRRFSAARCIGIVLLRLRNRDVHSCIAAMKRLLNSLTDAEIGGRILVVEEARIRVRELPSSTGEESDETGELHAS